MHIAARCIGEKAQAWTQLGAAGSVFAAVTRCVYLETAGGEITWLIPPDIPMHRRAIQIAQLPAVQPGTAVGGGGDWLRVGDTCIDLGSADRWAPPPMPARREQERRGDEGVVRLVERPRGLAAWLFAPSLAGTDSPARGALEKQAAPSIRAVQDACGRFDLAGVLAAGRELIGLGAGLTPSGDDLVGAALFALYHTGCWDAAAIGSFLKQARSRTNAISFTIMADMAQGHGIAPLHDLLCALLSGAYRDVVETAMASLIRVGHNSGWDMLAGLLIGLDGYNRAATSCCLSASEAANRH